MLRNRIYRGRIVHKDKLYPGEHTEIHFPTDLLVRKPYDPDELGRRIREVLDGSPGT